MADANNFQHSKYSRTDPGERVKFLETRADHPWGSPAWIDGIHAVGRQLRARGVRGVLLVSGLPYGDVFGSGRLDEVGGLKRGYSRGIPGMESLLALLRPASNGLGLADGALAPPLEHSSDTAAALDAEARDIGNFSDDYLAVLQQGFGTEEVGRLTVARHIWSSVNHHVGRVKAVLDLLEFLDQWVLRLEAAHDERLLLAAHGHGGQVLSLLSNLIAAGEVTNRQIMFQALVAYHERSQDPCVTPDRLDRLYRRLVEGSFLGGRGLDMVTMGTPVRGGWDTTGGGRLLHIVNHRHIRGDKKRWLAKMELPQVAWEIPLLSGGDYVQQLAVAGSDAVASSTAEEFANQELREILEPYDGFERWLECARRGTRCQNSGTCLLVDYQPDVEESPRAHLYGHGCYTRKQFALFNFEEIARHLGS